MRITHKIKDLKILFTKDQFYIKQYYKLRQESFRVDNGWTDYDGSETECDKKSHIIIALDGDQFIGGIKIMLESECDYFSCETPNSKYIYRKYLEFKNETTPLNTIAEISSLVVSKEYRNSFVSLGLANCAIEFAKSRKINYIFSIASEFHCRIHKLIYKRIGYNAMVGMNYPWKKEEKYSNIETFLIYIKIPQLPTIE